MPHMIHFAAPPMLARRLRSDIETAFPDHCLSPPGTHLEMFEAAMNYGMPSATAEVMTVTAYPQLLNRVIEGGAKTAPLSYPPLRAELVEAGLSSPHPGIAIIAAIPLVLAVDRRQLPAFRGWDDLRPLVEESGRVAVPPEDTPLPYLLSAFLAERWGMAEAEIRARFDRESPPLDINKRLGKGEVAAGFLPPAFCRNAREGATELVWPEGGPLVAPIFAVIAPDAPPETHALLGSLFTKEMQQLFAELGGMIPVIDHVAPPQEMEKAGWALQPARWPAFLEIGRLMAGQLAQTQSGEQPR